MKKRLLITSLCLIAVGFAAMAVLSDNVLTGYVFGCLFFFAGLVAMVVYFERE